MPKNSRRNPAAKVLRALGWLVTHANDDYGVRELAAALRIQPSGAHRLLAVLLEEDYVRQEAPGSRYRLGPELLRLANIALARSPLSQLAHAPMCQLVKASGESALLGHLDPAKLEMMFVKIVESNVALRYAVELNCWMPVYAGASGLAIMAFLTPEQIDQIVRDTHLTAVTPRTVTDPVKLRALLKQIRRRGYAVTRGQRVPGAVGIAAPIFDHNGIVVGDICLTVPEQRFDGNERDLPRLVGECASAITIDIGGRAPAAS